MTKLFSKTKDLLEKHEWIIPLGLFILFLAFTLPGISWGAPDLWHPDEVVARSIKALHGEWQFSEINFDYPDLPQYTMFWLGKLILALGKTDNEVLIASRVLSAVIAGLVIVITYIIARQAGGNVAVASLSGLLLLCVSELSHNGRFAHNDTYLTFFTTLAILFLVLYQKSRHKFWLYASMIAVGMAASSKYIGGSLILAVVAVYLILQRDEIKKDFFSILETLFTGGILTFLGYAIGTPKSLFWMTFYFKRVFTALNWQVNYGRQPDSIRGIIGQYRLIAEGTGPALYWLFIIAFLWICYKVIQSYRGHTLTRDSQTGIFATLLLAMVVLDLPMTVSYNYQIRYFLTLMPLFAILSAFALDELYTRTAQLGNPIFPKMVVVGVSLIVLVSMARLVSVMFLFMNDSRIPASKFVASLPAGTSIEETYYPPTIPENHFSREHNYPLFFQKSADQTAPTNKAYKFNTGEAGLDKRMTDYLVVDSFTSDKFKDPYTCKAMQVECDFFKQLDTGQSNHYKLIAEFKYTLPGWLPNIYVAYANPTIRIFERIP